MHSKFWVVLSLLLIVVPILLILLSVGGPIVGYEYDAGDPVREDVREWQENQ